MITMDGCHNEEQAKLL